MEHLRFHECDIFGVRGIECPFRDLTKEERKRKRERDKEEKEAEEEERDEIKVMVPARRRTGRDHRITREMEMVEQFRDMPVIAHGDPEMKKALERMRSMQNEGGLPSIPRIPGLPLPELEGRGLIALLAAIAISEGLRQLRSTGSMPSFQAVRASETRAAQGLSKLSRTGKVGHRGGFGGLMRQADRFRTPLRTSPKVSRERDIALRRLLGFSLGRPSSGSGSDDFSETGF